MMQPNENRLKPGSSTRAGLGILLLLLLGGAGVWIGLHRKQPALPVPEPTKQASPAGGRSEEPAGVTLEMPPVASADKPLDTAGDSRPPLEMSLSGAESPRVASLLAEGLPRQERPWADEEGHPLMPSPADSMIRSLKDEIATSTGPEAMMHARRLLESPQAGVGLVGAALMLDQPPASWDADLVRLIADNNDPSVPFFALQALHDAGMSETYADLQRRIASRFQDADWVALLEAGEWTGTALRGLFDVVREAGTPEQRLDLVGEVLAAEAVDYGARMQALLELEELLPFEDYRAAVQEELNRTRGDEPSIWQMGLAQLAQRMEGPVEVHAGPAVLTTHDIEAMTAREVPTMYEDLALRVEMMARQPDSVFDHGVLDKLNDVIAQARKYPLADDQANALRRIELLMPTLVESSAAGLVPPPPPGS